MPGQSQRKLAVILFCHVNKIIGSGQHLIWLTHFVGDPLGQFLVMPRAEGFKDLIITPDVLDNHDQKSQARPVSGKERITLSSPAESNRKEQQSYGLAARRRVFRHRDRPLTTLIVKVP